MGCAAALAWTVLAFPLGARSQQAATSNPPSSETAPPAAASVNLTPIAIVPINASATVTGALEVSSGKAIIANSGTIASGDKATDVILPRRGTLRVCASTTLKLSTDTSVPAGEMPGMMMALDHGAIEASFATGRNADTLLTPDFRILISAPGSSDLKVRLGQQGDTCVDNPIAPGNTGAPYVIVTSVFDGGAYRVQPGQRVMFQHGSLQEVVDNEKEPCGCPPQARPGSNDFPLAESAGLAPTAPPVTPAPASPATPSGTPSPIDQPLVYQAPQPAPDQAGTNQAAAAAPSATAPAASTVPPAKPTPPKKQGFFHGVKNFFRKIFGAE